MSKKAYNLFSLCRFLFEEAVLAILLFLILPQINVHPPIWLVIILMLLYAIYNCITSIIVAKIIERRSAVGMEALINSRCQTVTDLNPDGYVKVGTELWRACSLSGSIGSGNEVEIKNVNGLTIVVKKVE
jgi:membrane-bound ClpP family serine protease